VHTMSKAYSYIRFSDPSQAQGDSYRRQLTDTVAYCKEEGLELVSDSDYTFFDKGISAYSGKLRDDDTELSRFLSLVKDGSIAPGSTLIIESLDRLSREHVKKALPLFMQLLSAGIRLHTLHSRKTYTNEYDEFDLFASILEMSRSYRESLWKSQRIAARWQQKQEQARKGIPLGKTKPAWLDLVYADGTTTPPANDPKAKAIGYRENDKVEVVKKIFQHTLDGHGRNIVARMLNAESIPAFKTKNGWGASTINQILNNEAVLGIYQPSTKGEDGKRVPRGEPIADYYPQIIDRDMFERARAAVAGRDAGKARKQTPEFQVWQGIAKCALCGSPLHSYSNGRKKEGKPPPRWMRCYNAKKGKCEAGSLSVAKLEPLFAEILAKLNVLALVQSSATAINTKLEVVTGQLVAERARLTKFKGDYATRQSSTILDLIYETEAAVEALEAQERQHLTDLAADQVIDKQDFFAKLDLHSFPGRSRANSILKRLKVEVRINPAEQRFQVVKAGEPVFDILDHPIHGLRSFPATAELGAVIQLQDHKFMPKLKDDADYIQPDDIEDWEVHPDVL
jgi:DNA invertase Pin-like site-specific DNA recombinase